MRVCVSTSKAYLFNACVSKAQRQRTANALQATRSGRSIESPPLHKYGASAFHPHFRRIASAQRKCSVSTAQIRRASATQAQRKCATRPTEGHRPAQSTQWFCRSRERSCRCSLGRCFSQGRLVRFFSKIGRDVRPFLGLVWVAYERSRAEINRK